MSRSRRILSAALVAIGALVYGVSPIDVIPEFIAGPLGLTDDLAVLLGAAFAVWKLLTGSDPRTTGGVPPAGGVPPRAG
jgi:uncharacterized membrane protein YkvA (DUF1232 family)